MCLAVTARRKMDRAIQTTTPADRPGVIAGLVRTLVHLELFAAESEHFRHEWRSIQTSIAIECLKDLFLAAHLHPVADPELPLGSHAVMMSLRHSKWRVE